MTPRSAPNTELSSSGLPDLCHPMAILSIVLLTQLAVVLLFIAPSTINAFDWNSFAIATAFAQWLALVDAVCACKLRLHLAKLFASPVLFIFALFLTLIAINGAAAAVIAWLDKNLMMSQLPLNASGLEFTFSIALISALVIAVALRYFYIQGQWQTNVKAQAAAKIEALQARIRPHFLFNSLNTIAALVSLRPREAEQALENLSDLFRAALRAGDQLTTLEQELEMGQRYLDIEKLRLAARLQLQFDIPNWALATPIPPLTLQPLLENAVLHGIERLSEGGVLSVIATKHAGKLQIEIRNPKPRMQTTTHSGNNMAVENVKHRLAFHFQAHAMMQIEQDAQSYLCRLILPLP